MGWFTDSLKAIEEYQKVIAKEPDNIDVYVSLIWLCDDVYQFYDALDYAQKVLELQPDHPKVKSYYKWLLGYLNLKPKLAETDI